MNKSILERLKGYNPPDRTIEKDYQIAVDISDAIKYIESLKKLLKTAGCPDRHCDNEGNTSKSYTDGCGDLQIEFVKCQWCDERKQLLKD